MTTDTPDPHDGAAWAAASRPGGTQARPGDRRVPLGVALRAASGELGACSPPPWLESRALAAMAAAQAHAASGPRQTNAQGTARREAGAWRWPALAALAVVVLLSLALAVALPSAQRGTRDAVANGIAAYSGFVPVTGVDALHWPALPATPAWLVTTEMPRERLGLLGLPYDPARAGENVRAELLMHGSGAVLAVRLVTP